MKKTTQHIFSALTVAVFLFLAFGSDDDTNEPATKRTSVSEYEAKAVAEGQIKAVLKAPSTATFSGLRDTKFEPIENGYRVIGHVDSQNSFGAMIRSKYSVEIFVDIATGDIMYRNIKVD